MRKTYIIVSLTSFMVTLTVTVVSVMVMVVLPSVVHESVKMRFVYAFGRYCEVFGGLMSFGAACLMFAVQCSINANGVSGCV